MILQADLHTHTIASTHAYSTILENCDAVSKIGIKCIAMTDHAPAMPDSPHLWHFENMRVLPRQISGVTVLKGVEANIINADGELDYPKDLQEKAEWIVASMHQQTTPLKTVDEIMLGYFGAMQNKNVDLLGHCTMERFPCDFQQIVKWAVEYNKIIEINESSIMSKRSSRENCMTLLKLCKKYDAKISIDSDGHFCQLLGKAPIAISMAEEIDFPEELVINHSWDNLRNWILDKRKNLDI